MREQDVGMTHELASGYENMALRGNVTDGFGHRCIEVEGWLATQVGLRLCDHS